MAMQSYKGLMVEEGDTVVLSARIIPGNERLISRMIGFIYKRGANIIEEKRRLVHVSGHASQEDIRIMTEAVRPKFVVPIHGEYRMLVQHGLLAEGAGVDVAWYFDEVFRAFEETGMILGMHTFPAPGRSHPLGPDYLTSPGELFTRAGTDSQTFSFIHEMQVWVAQVLLSGFLDRYPRLRMAVFESNAEWLPYTLETCDRLWKLYARERGYAGDRLPSEAFLQQSVHHGLMNDWQMELLTVDDDPQRLLPALVQAAGMSAQRMDLSQI